MLDRRSRLDQRGPIDEPREGDCQVSFRSSGPLDLLAEELSRRGVAATVCGRFSPGNPAYLRVGEADGENILVVGGRFEFGFGSPIGPVADISAAALYVQRFLASR